MIDKKTIVTLLFLGYCFVGIGQFSAEQIITQEAQGARSVVAADLDGDGYQDVISSNQFVSEIVWNRNLGNGAFSERIVIASLQESINAHVGDVDGDGDIDVIAVSTPLDKIVWYENLDGQATFGAEQLISNTSDFVTFIFPIDIDGDGDLDMVSGSDGSGIQWHTNLDGQGTSWGTQLVDNKNSRSVAVADVDGDEDLDIVAASSGGETVVWYENLNGQGDFAPLQVIFGQQSAVASVVTADIDGDGDMDVVGCTFVNSELSWYENLDGAGTFGPPQVFGTGIEGAFNLEVADLDNDGDPDVACSFSVDDTVAWYENTDGLGVFGAPQILNDNADSTRWVIAADLDNDGDNDVVSASRNDNKIAWYENFTILGLEENILEGVEVYPNPSRDILYVQIPAGIAISEINIRNIQGKTVLQPVKAENYQIDVSGLASGVYFITVSTSRQAITKRVIIQ